ncbi:MAG: DUF6389 family protein [Pseudomonadota bacterium]
MMSFLKSLFGAKQEQSKSETEETAQGFKRLPAPDSVEAYAAILREILVQQDVFARRQLKGALAHWPDKATGLHFGIHPDQDGEGTFDVMLHVQGPDSYVINKAISEYRRLFEIKRMPGGLNISVPLFDPDEVDYEVRDVIADVAMDWAENLWAKEGKNHPDLPVLIFCDEDWGNAPARWLQGEP